MAYPTGYRRPEGKSLRFDSFRGYDFSSSPLNAQPYRATGGRNFIRENGVNHKRYGANEVVNFGNGFAVNGIWQFVDADGEEHTIVHCGNRIYRVRDLAAQENSFTQNVEDLTLKAGSRVDLARISPDTRSYAVVQRGRLFLFCGDYLMYVKRDDWVLERVYDNPDTYVPTTSISIDAVGATNSDVVTLDEVNLLSPKRINKMTVPHDLEDAKYADGLVYYLDTPVIDRATVEVEIQTYKASNKSVVRRVYRNRLENNVWGGALYLAETSETGETVPGTSAVGTVYFGDNEDARLVIHSRETVKPAFPDDHADRISVTFTRTNADYANRITRCTFGTLFGTYGNTDRLFVSGDPDHKNVDFFSAMDDFTYFGDQSSAVIGSDTVPIMGYSRLGDGTLAIHKAPSHQEATICYRSGELEPVYGDVTDGGTVIGQKIVGQRAVFPLRSGAIGEGAVSRYAFDSLSGDNLLLSENGVYGIVLAANVATNERYARERSRFVNTRLSRERGLSEAVAIVYRNKYHLAVNGHCYVADAVSPYRAQGDMSDTFNYEWWYWDNVPARVWAVFGNALYYGTADGRICRFTEGSYTDRSYVSTSPGEVSVSMDGTGEVTISNVYGGLIERLGTPRPGRKDFISLRGGDSGALYAVKLEAEEIDRVENGRVYLKDAELIQAFAAEETVYADDTAESGLTVDAEYRVTAIDALAGSFALSVDGAPVKLTDSAAPRFCLKRRADGQQYELVGENAGGEQRYHCLERGRDVRVRFCPYDGRVPDLVAASFFLNDNVVAEWFTPITDLGTPVYSKNVTAVTVTAETNISGEVRIGYQTRRVERLFATHGTSLFDFDSIDFNYFTFETSDFTKSYTKKIKEKNVNYIVFSITSENAYDCAVNGIVVEYRLGKKNKGVN